jgi:hypothetical protein
VRSLRACRLGSMRVIHDLNGRYFDPLLDLCKMCDVLGSFTRPGTPLVTEAHLPSNQLTEADSFGTLAALAGFITCGKLGSF